MTRGGHNFSPQVRRSSPPPACGSNLGPNPVMAAVAPLPTAIVAAVPTTAAASSQSAHARPAAVAAIVASIVLITPTLAPRRYATRVSPILPSSPHPRPTQRAPLSKRAQTSSLGESSSSKPQEPQSPPNQCPAGALPLDLSPTSIIRRPIFHCNPISGNADCSTRDLHNKVYYDLLAFAEDPELRDYMRLVQQYSLEPFMTPRRFFYPRVVIEFYHTMKSKREPNPTTIYFSIDGRVGILRATYITATFNLLVVLANSVD